MHFFSENAEICRLACQILSCISEDSHIVDSHIVTTQAPELVLNAMARHPHDWQVQLNAACVVRYWCECPYIMVKGFCKCACSQGFLLQHNLTERIGKCFCFSSSRWQNAVCVVLNDSCQRAHFILCSMCWSKEKKNYVFFVRSLASCPCNFRRQAIEVSALKSKQKMNYKQKISP